MDRVRALDRVGLGNARILACERPRDQAPTATEFHLMIRFTLTAHDDETGETVTLHNEVLPFRPAPRASHKKLRALARAVEKWASSNGATMAHWERDKL